jgi:serine/threonine protein kinase
MEHIKHGSLNDWDPLVIPFGRLTIRDIAQQLCRGIEAMHSAGLAHQDLNPNVCHHHILQIQYT